MPLGRYFTLVGGALLALLFFADWYMPELSAQPNRADVDKSIIRIHTMHRWPDAIVFDTSLPTISPPPVIAAELPAKKRTPRDALALAQASPPAAALVETKSAAMKGRSRAPPVAPRGIATYRASSAEVFPAGW
jgi:hypothetical protein